MARGWDEYSGHTKTLRWSTTFVPGNVFTLATKGYSLTGQNSDGACVFCVNYEGHWAAICYDTSEVANGRWQYQAHTGGGATASMIDDTDWVENKWFSLVARSHQYASHEFDGRRLDTGRTFNDTSTGGPDLSGSNAYDFIQGNNDASYSYDRGFDGYWAECAYWDVALTDAEVEAYNLGYAPPLIRPESLIFYDPARNDLRPDQIGGRTGTESSGTVATFPHPPGIIYKE